MSQRVYVALSRAIFDSDLIASRLALALAEMCWAVTLMWPGDTFIRPTYILMNHVASEHAWAFAFFVTSIMQFSIVVQADYHSKFARYFAGWNAALWVFTVSSMWLSVHPPLAAIGGEIALMVTATWIWLRPFVLAEGLHRAYG